MAGDRGGWLGGWDVGLMPGILSELDIKGTLSLRFLFPYIKGLDPLNTVNTLQTIFLPPNP